MLIEFRFGIVRHSYPGYGCSVGYGVEDQIVFASSQPLLSGSSARAQAAHADHVCPLRSFQRALLLCVVCWGSGLTVVTVASTTSAPSHEAGKQGRYLGYLCTSSTEQRPPFSGMGGWAMKGSAERHRLDPLKTEA